MIMALPGHINTIEKRKFFNDNAVKIRGLSFANSFEGMKTEITTDPTPINIPEKAKWGIILINPNEDIVWIGNDDTISAAGSNVFPLIQNVPIEIMVKKGTIIYGIVAADTENIYVGGVIRQ